MSAGLVCYLEPDVSLARVIGPNGTDTWRAERASDSPTDDPMADTVEALRRRVAACAAWAAERAGPGARFDVVCLGVERAMCTRLSAPSAESRVVAAAVRQREQEWGERAMGASVQPLTTPSRQTFSAARLARLARRKSARPAARSMQLTILRLRDGAARLWLDELDARGVRVGAVTTAWHAMCLVWGEDHTPESVAPPDGTTNGAPGGPRKITAIALADDAGHIAWAWAEGRSLLAGGSIALATEQGTDAAGNDDFAPECGRLALDWLTWSAQLGRAPDRVIIVGLKPDALAKRLGSVWPSAPVTVRHTPDPLGALLAGLGESARGVETQDPRAAVVDLSTRPGRVHRRLFVWGAGAIALLAVGVAGFGLSLQRQIGEWKSLERQLREEMREEARNLDERLAQSNNLDKAVESLVAQLRQQNPTIVEPPPPRPILQELTRLALQMRSLEGKKGATVERFKVSEEEVSANVIVEEFGVAEALRAALLAEEGAVRWNGRIEGQPPRVTLRMTGEWRDRR